MGLSGTLAKLATRHAHVLVVEVPGFWRSRVEVEREVDTRGWRLATSPADADVLAVCGRPGAQMSDIVENVWHQMPGPRVRTLVEEYGAAADSLDEASRDLLDTAHHKHDAESRPAAAELVPHDGMDHDDHGGMDHGGMDHGGHGGMDHSDMDMSPGGIPLAEGGEDRDGLEMDVLNVRLGPVLPHWPAGLVLRCSLQGDVIVDARAQLLDGTGHHDGGPVGSARRLDNIAALLALAGWDGAAAEARRLRDDALEGDGPAGRRVDRLRRKVRRSQALRWSLRSVRPLTSDAVQQQGLPADAAGDTYDRLIGMLDRAADAGGAGARTLSTDQLAPVVIGLDLATARLVVASLDIDELRAEHAEPEVSHG